jgi:hypothetical protein
LPNSIHIYLSPHQDDVCFSLAATARQQGGELLNLFTRSLYVAAEMALPDEPSARVAFVSQLRRSEDLRFAAAAGLNRHDLQLSEPGVVGLRSFDLNGIAQEVEMLSRLLIPYLERLLPDTSTPADACLYVPMGIGGHRNHVSTMLTIGQAFARLARRCRIRLYEDLHYASDGATRTQGLGNAAKIFSGIRMVPEIHRLDTAEARWKMDAVNLYASQHNRTPSPTAYSPASGDHEGMHEIIYDYLPALADESRETAHQLAASGQP